MGNKRRANKAKLDQFLEYLHSTETKISQDEYLQMVREKVKECIKLDQKSCQTNYILEKICEVCNDYHDDDQLLLCDYCDDAFHTFCLNPPLKEIPDEDEDWFCPVCVEQKYQMEKEKRKSDGKRSNSKVQRLLESYQFRNKKEIVSKIQICGKCDDMILYIENEGVIEESEKCIKCTKIFHKQCFSKKDKPSILCTGCQNSIQKQIPLTQKLIQEYFIRDQQQSLNDLQCLRYDEKEKKINSDKKKTNKKMIEENQQVNVLPSNEILDIDQIKRNERMQARLEKKEKLQKEEEENQNKQDFKNKKKQADERNKEREIEKINDEYIKNSSSISNRTRQQVLSKKRKMNDHTEFISNQLIEDSLTQPLNPKSQKQQNSNSDTITLPLKQNSIMSQYNDDSESTVSTACSTTTSDQNKNNVQKNNQKQKNSQGVKFLLPVPSSNPLVNLKCKQSLIYALKAKNITFCDDLTYTQSCIRSDNNANLEPDLQVMDLTNQIIFNKFKEMSRQGVYVPVVVEEDKIQGFIVRAMEDIKAKTIITEYVGEVDFARNHIFDKNDSIMDLLRTARSKTSLVILPDKKGNLARFLSGINNTSKKSMARQNVQSARFNVNGESHVILYSKKNIKKGDLLYYDYNAGGFGEYPTSEFV